MSCIIQFPHRASASTDGLDADVIRQMRQIEKETGRRVSVISNEGSRVLVQVFDAYDSGVAAEVLRVWIVSAAIRDGVLNVSIL